MQRKRKRRLMRLATTATTTSHSQLRNGLSVRDEGCSGVGSSSSRYFEKRPRQTDDQRSGGSFNAVTIRNSVVPAPSAATKTTSSASSSSSAFTSSPMQPSRCDTNSNPNCSNTTHKNENVSTTTDGALLMRTEYAPRRKGDVASVEHRKYIVSCASPLWPQTSSSAARSALVSS